MRQVILFIIIFCNFFWLSSFAYAESYEKAFVDIEQLKLVMITNSAETGATEDGVTCGALVSEAWKQAEVDGISRFVNVQIRPAFTEALHKRFWEKNGFDCLQANILTWSQVTGIAQKNGGLLLFSESDISDAFNEVSGVESIKPVAVLVHSANVHPEEPVQVVSEPMVVPVVESVSVPVEEAEPVIESTAETVDVASQTNDEYKVPLAIDIVRGTKTIGVRDLRPAVIRTEAQLLAQLKADEDAAAKAEREALEAEARVKALEEQEYAKAKAEERLKREAEDDRQRYEAVTRGFKKADARREKPRGNQTSSQEWVKAPKRQSTHQDSSRCTRPRSERESVRDLYHNGSCPPGEDQDSSLEEYAPDDFSGFTNKELQQIAKEQAFTIRTQSEVAKRMLGEAAEINKTLARDTLKVLEKLEAARDTSQ